MLLRMLKWNSLYLFSQDPAASTTSEGQPDAKGETVAMNYKPTPLQVQIGMRISDDVTWLNIRSRFSGYLPVALKSCSIGYLTV